jgi:hypothetical protein
MAGDFFVRNGDFSDGFASWTLTGAASSALICNESNKIFARLGPDVVLHQDIDGASGSYRLVFQFNPQDASGVRVVVRCLNDDGQLAEQSPLTVMDFGGAPGWIMYRLDLEIPCNKVRLAFHVPTATDIADVYLDH